MPAVKMQFVYTTPSATAAIIKIASGNRMARILKNQSSEHGDDFGQKSPEYLSTDVYFSADVETDGPIPGPFSMLSFALVYAGQFDGVSFERPQVYDRTFYVELKPISDQFDEEALQINGLDRGRLCREGALPETAMTEAAQWVRTVAGSARPVLVAYPLSFDWTWLYWYFIRYSAESSPFSYSSCFDLKTAFAIKADIPIAQAGRKSLLPNLRSVRLHTHHALDDAKEQAEIFANIFEWEGIHDRHPGGAKGK